MRFIPVVFCLALFLSVHASDIPEEVSDDADTDLSEDEAIDMFDAMLDEDDENDPARNLCRVSRRGCVYSVVARSLNGTSTSCTRMVRTAVYFANCLANYVRCVRNGPRPTWRPSGRPTRPTWRPTRPTGRYTRPTGRPTWRPTGWPTGRPTWRPTRPTGRPSWRPTNGTRPVERCSASNPCGYNSWCDNGRCRCAAGISGPMCRVKTGNYYASCTSNPCRYEPGTKCFDYECEGGGASCLKCIKQANTTTQAPPRNPTATEFYRVASTAQCPPSGRLSENDCKSAKLTAFVKNLAKADKFMKHSNFRWSGSLSDSSYNFGCYIRNDGFIHYNKKSSGKFSTSNGKMRRSLCKRAVKVPTEPPTEPPTTRRPTTAVPEAEFYRMASAGPCPAGRNVGEAVCKDFRMTTFMKALAKKDSFLKASSYRWAGSLDNSSYNFGCYVRNDGYIHYNKKSSGKFSSSNAQKRRSICLTGAYSGDEEVMEDEAELLEEAGDLAEE